MVGVLTVVVVTCIIVELQYDMNAGLAILAGHRYRHFHLPGPRNLSAVYGGLPERHPPGRVRDVRLQRAVGRGLEGGRAGRHGPARTDPAPQRLFAICLGVVCIAQVTFRRLVLAGEREKYCQWLPNWMATGVAFVIPRTICSTVTLFGRHRVARLGQEEPRQLRDLLLRRGSRPDCWRRPGWSRRRALELGGVSGATYGTQIACPLDSC